MRDNFSQIPAWTWLALAAALAPLAAWIGASAGWTPGAAPLAILALPVAAAALTGQRGSAFAAAGIFVAACLLEVLLKRPAAFTSTAAAILPALSAGVIASGMAMVSAVVGALRDRAAELETQNTRYMRELYRRDRASCDDSSSDGASPGALGVADGQPVVKVDYAMLLLTLQEIGRRVSLNLDNNALVPTIINTARTSLKCGRVGIWFWNAAERTFRPAHNVRAADAPRYVPRPESGMGGWVCANRLIITRRAIEEDYNLRALLDQEPDLPDAIAPLTVGGELIGLLVVDEIEGESLTFLRLLHILASIYALGIKNGQLFRRIEDMARRDGLTGLFNHVAFQQKLTDLVRESDRTGAPLAIVMSDIDRFKRFNDEQGHQAGDHVLVEAARLWRAVLPETAFVARYGGEEFICALPGATLAEGLEAAGRLRAAIEAHPFDFEGRALHVTASFGVAELGGDANTPRELIRRADAALYRAKETGRNRVVAADQLLEVA